MTTVLSLVETQLRALLVERRGFVRHRIVMAVNLPVGVSVPNENLDPEAELYPQPIMGQTRDVSENGLSLLLPSLYLGQQQISAPGFPLRLVLSLPGGIAIVQVVTVRIEATASMPEGADSFIVGASIRKMSEPDHKRYLALVRSCG